MPEVLHLVAQSQHGERGNVDEEIFCLPQVSAAGLLLVFARLFSRTELQGCGSLWIRG